MLTASTKTDTLSLTRKDLRKGRTFHNSTLKLLRAPVHRIGIQMETLQYRKCGEAEATPCHVLFDCPIPRFCLPRSRTLEVGEEGVGINDEIVGRVTGFCKDVGFDVL